MSSRRIGHADELALAAGVIELIHDRAPHLALRGIVRRRGFALDTHHGAHRIADRRSMPPEEDHRRRAVAGDVRARGVDDVREIDRGAELPR